MEYRALMRAIGASGAAAFGPGSTHSHLGATFSPPREARRKGVECRPVTTERPRQAARSLPTCVVKPPRRPHPGAPHRVTLLCAFSAGGCSAGAPPAFHVGAYFFGSGNFPAVDPRRRDARARLARRVPHPCFTRDHPYCPRPRDSPANTSRTHPDHVPDGRRLPRSPRRRAQLSPRALLILG